MTRKMDFCKTTIFLVALFKANVSQKISFNEPIKLDTVNGLNGQHGNWSVQGKITLSTTDLLIFKQAVSIQATNEICMVDLSQCPPKDAHRRAEACYCKEKNGDEHSIHIGSTAKPSQSGASLTAIIPSRDMFLPIAGMSVIGQLPYISNSMVKATYQVDDMPTKPLLASQIITVCADIFVTIKLCIDKRKAGTLIKVDINGGQTILSGNVCVDFAKKYKFDVIPVYTLTVSYIESITVPEMLAGFTILIQENNECHIPTVMTIATPSQSIPVQSNLSQVVAESMSSLAETLSSVKGNQEQLKTLIQGVGFLLNVSLSKHIYCSKEIGCEILQKTDLTSRCYKLELKSKLSWHDAVKSCQALGGFLAEINDDKTLNYVKRLVAKSTPATEGVWLGASDENDEGVWTWGTSRTYLSITDWGKGQPDDYKLNEDCLEVRMNLGVVWNDMPCNFKSNYLCQKNTENCNDWI